ncbi:hypothetical protein TVAG_055560 [Trichomonas vaginalis G3]|uniref:Peptidase C14 caspase domain-containing protein n=1 Tax=Trichomonas vaginalis (strain ATCC PRA-98 / G3) TaxID=412133 RepID=A2EXZ9_TRIV3|nr:cysteine-type peptidase protein [Trichomonas vaginalis G3]EAY02467.1 hypothetical protein TVAG_055560 [Trichomonas vaginalis G3]KAI5511216.1 cysteine-type peptidase protein [Trichomonas vaginalis G3]|eukprot:XP_001314706.1 hypothetical protein [Trichomonas vaginalis G3]
MADEKLSSVVKNITEGDMPNDLDRAALMVINDYNNTKWDLGTGPDNDGYHMSKIFGEYGFNVFYIRNAKKERFLELLDHFFENTKTHLIVYYVGHGTNIKDIDGDEDDGFDEAFFFVNGAVVDDVLIKHLCEKKNPSSVLTLVTDACHSGSIWDIQGGNTKGRTLPKNVISISAASDKQTAKQTVVEKVEQGMFSYNLRKLLRTVPNAKPAEVKKGLKTVLEKFCQTCNIALTSRELLDLPIMKP